MSTSWQNMFEAVIDQLASMGLFDVSIECLAERVAFLFERYQQLTVPLAVAESVKTSKTGGRRSKP